MDLILIFVVLPLATIIFSIALQRLLKCPILVAAIIFAIFLILTYTVFGTDFIIFAILFAILAFITAFLVNLFCKITRRLRDLERRNSDCNCDEDDDYDDDCCRSSRSGRNRRRRRDCDCEEDDENLLTISSRCGNSGENTRLLTISTGGTCGNNNDNNNSNCNNESCGCNSCGCDNGNSNCGCNNNSNNERIVLNAEVVPTNNGRSGAFRGCFRRRC